MKKLAIGAFIAATCIAAPASAYDPCQRWSSVYAKTQTDTCFCKQVRDRGGRQVWTCNGI